ncbi:SDR family NAD(P)-dependent oxidoreductase [Nocardia sp. ET3-3]|uniref:SDR family NAD(P)-dependent oxidoreductase n=1 Tax=Nocardia terrae TaxID=2675851 RepID=A0A7K1UV49_9NOCA|nr:SDR family NAD(P)-dependent oxidoreductase [Nocardia terrae]MVU78162.1 SDR family NAD(P)-dependent oxidoreductase [Nocardia terrae]
MTKIADSAILVTGGGRGIGRALVSEALKRGARRVYVGTRKPLTHPDDRVTPLTLDVTDSSLIQQAVEQVESLDILINNAGVTAFDDLGDQAVLEQQLAVNLFGPRAVIQAFLPLLPRGAAIVNIHSLASIAPTPFSPSYSISKAAALSMTQAQRMYLADAGVAVHAVLPGPVDTEMNADLTIPLPMASAESVAAAIFDGVEAGDDDIFPDPVSEQLAEGWRTGVTKALEKQFAELPKSV